MATATGATNKKRGKYRDIDMTPPEAVREAAREGLRLREEHGRGGTQIGVRRANGLADGKKLTARDIKSIYSYFARHEVDKQAAGFRDKANPSAGYIAWQLWGGDAGKQWVDGVHAQIEKADAG